MGIQKWDFFAIKQYPFTLNKTTSFFTLPTILLSILIVFLSIYVNIEIICHLWMSCQELPITLAHTLSYPSQLTSTRLCYRPKKPNPTLPACLTQNELILATRSTIMPIISIMDGELNTVSILTPIQGPQCLADLTSRQVQQVSIKGQNTQFYCFQGGLTLKHSNHDRQRTALYIDNSNQASIYTMFHFSQPSPTTHYRPIDPPPKYYPYLVLYYFTPHY